MITVNYCRHMARYNASQNRSLLAAVDSLTDPQRRQDRGAFFGSIAATLTHIYLGDVLWLDRLAGNEHPPASLLASVKTLSDWAVFKDRRAEQDVALSHWASTLAPDALEG